MNATSFYPRPHIDQTRVAAIGHAGGLLLTDTIRATSIAQALSSTLARWRKPFTRHDPAKILLDLAVSLSLGGDALSDIDLVRAEPAVYGRVASDSTVSRLMSRLGNDADLACQAISDARAVGRAHAWAAAGAHAPDAEVTPDAPLIVDLDATLITSHSEKEHAAPTYKRGYGFHPLLAFIDHGTGAAGEPVAGILRPGNAGANTADDHIEIVEEVLRQLPNDLPRDRVMIRTDGAGGTKAFLAFLTEQQLRYCVGYGLPFITTDLYRQIDEEAWEPALDAGGVPRHGADVTEITGLLPTGKGWPAGMRVVMRRELPHPGAQLRFEDVDGYRLTAFATNMTTGTLPRLELQHRERARCEDRIRCMKAAGLTNFPLQSFAQNQVWLQVVLLASEITAWMGLLALTMEQARVWEPKKLRYRLYAIPATIARSGRRTVMHFSHRHPEAGLVVDAITRLRMLPSPAT